MMRLPRIGTADAVEVLDQSLALVVLFNDDMQAEPRPARAERPARACPVAAASRRAEHAVP
jgi:hypothetical protein